MKEKISVEEFLNQEIFIQCGSDQLTLTGRIIGVHNEAFGAEPEFLDIAVDVSLKPKETIAQWDAIKKASQMGNLLIQKDKLRLLVQFCKSSLKIPNFQCKVLSINK